MLFLAGAFLAGGILASGAAGAANTQLTLAEGFAPVASAAMPTVVNISSARIVRAPQTGPPGPFFFDPFCREFFGDQFNIPRERREQSLRSGVIVSPQGYPLTNHHVIDKATEIRLK